jgi:hypothetical protein
MTKHVQHRKKGAATVALPTRGRGRPPATVRVEAMTIKFAPDVRTLILEEVHRRKTARAPNRTIQAVVSEAVLEKFGKQ